MTKEMQEFIYKLTGYSICKRKWGYTVFYKDCSLFWKIETLGEVMEKIKEHNKNNTCTL